MSYETIFTIFIIGIICFFINVPFGMVRSRFTSYSIMWFLSIHAPIPVAAILRRSAGFSFWYVFIFMIFAGQIIGKKIALKYFPPK